MHALFVYYFLEYVFGLVKKRGYKESTTKDMLHFVLGVAMQFQNFAKSAVELTRLPYLNMSIMNVLLTRSDRYWCARVVLLCLN
ncbi:hypothetical protein H310_10646 [Aphanomyces invadans]|uniref:Uncharacterized protein n=1 Tax=Aphanomyces invadans TaxID=157072 RepID=A0A024TQU8_9STRA|nr:hypothetical protein H310_10646 [Aphanomyces invadans]ETV95991.1 hypothetical protein H310_10646 [Aphanomyces invadans]|eukprot:XP_008875302.1 hypothetical protein H310_10646 [Aphanomyces invadans]